MISGGENISTVEIEQALLTHQAVLDAAVIGEEIIDHVKSTIARYKAPTAVAFLDELPTTSTGKVPKFELRELERAGQDSRI